MKERVTSIQNIIREEKKEENEFMAEYTRMEQ